jgi:hypothetical protein
MTKKKETLPLSVETDGLLETKLTRSEAIELMLEQAKELNDQRLKEIDEEHRELHKITHGELVMLTEAFSKGGTIEFNGWGGGEGLSFGGRLLLKEMPAWAKERQKRIQALADERSSLYNIQRALNDRGKAKLAIMKQVLESSAEGKAFLSQIEKMSISLNGRLLKAEKDPPTKMLVADTTVTVITKVKEQ